MSFMKRSKYFLIIALLTSQAFASSSMEDDTGAEFARACINVMETNLTSSRIFYKKCSFYKCEYLMREEMQDIINTVPFLLNLPEEWQNRFIRHIIHAANMSDEELDFTSYRFDLYTRGGKKAYINGMNDMSRGLRSLYEKLREEMLRRYALPTVTYYPNTAIDTDHWTRHDN